MHAGTVALAAAAIAAASTLAGAWLGARLADRGMAERFNAEQQAALHQRQFDRARDLYARLASSVETMRFVVTEQPYAYENETVEERDARHRKALQEEQERVGEVGGFILVDPIVSPVRDAYSELWHAGSRCLAEWKSPIADSGRPQRLNELTTDVLAKADAVLNVARTQLAALDEPVAIQPRGRSLCRR